MGVAGAPGAPAGLGSPVGPLFAGVRGDGGIGTAISQRPAADGAAVAIFDRNGNSAKDTAASVEAAGGTAIGVRVDVADRQPQDVAAACAFLVSEEASYITGQIIGVNGGRNT